MRRMIGALVLSLGLLAPMAVMTAQDHDRHVWADTEDPHWHQYLKEHHKKDHDWAHASKKEQRDYWKWRDAHPDAH
jgi:hypothetical protein